MRGGVAQPWHHLVLAGASLSSRAEPVPQSAESVAAVIRGPWPGLFQLLVFVTQAKG